MSAPNFNHNDGAIRPYSVQWVLPDGDEIDESTWTIDAVSGLDASNETNDETSTSVRLTASAVGTYCVTNSITTTGGLADSKYFHVTVVAGC